MERKDNQQWLWLVFHSGTRQVLAMHVGKRTKQSAEYLLEKLPEDFKKTIFYSKRNSAHLGRN
jgi:IS1 family transposase